MNAEWSNLESNFVNECSVCKYKAKCTGGCRGNAFNLKASINSKDPNCIIYSVVERIRNHGYNSVIKAMGLSKLHKYNKKVY